MTLWFWACFVVVAQRHVGLDLDDLPRDDLGQIGLVCQYLFGKGVTHQILLCDRMCTTYGGVFYPTDPWLASVDSLNAEDAEHAETAERNAAILAALMRARMLAVRERNLHIDFAALRPCGFVLR